MTSKQAFSSLCDSQHTERRESYVPLRKIRHQWRVFSGLYLSQLSRFNEVRPPCLHQGPNFECHCSVFHCSFCGLKTHSNVILEMPMWKQTLVVCLKLLIVILLSLRKGDIQLEVSQQLDAVSCLFASETPKCGTKLSLSEVRKQVLDGVSSSC